MIPAPYTPGTICRMRDLARVSIDIDIARELGWGLGRLHEAARRHGIKLRRAVPGESVVPAAPVIARQPEAPPKPKLKCNRLPARVVAGPVEWCAPRVTRGGVAVSLPPAQARIFDVLFARWRDQAGPIKGVEIGRATGNCSFNGGYIRQLREKLWPLRICITAISGRAPNVGYFLEVIEGESGKGV